MTWQPFGVEVTVSFVGPHLITGIHVFDGRYQAVCRCGWSYRDRDRATIEAAVHLHRAGTGGMNGETVIKIAC